MASAPPGFNFASAEGIQSLAAAVVFVVLYSPLFAFFLSKAIARPTYVYIILSFFCAVRFTAFLLRALLSHVPAAAENLNVLIAYEIIYNTGFFGLLYSAYILVTDRVAYADNPPNGPISRLLRMRFLFRIALAAAVSIGVTGAVESSLASSVSGQNTGNTLRKVAIYIFLICSILVLLQTFFLARVEFSEGGYRGANNRIGSTYGIYILSLISLLLVVREAFFTATATDLTQQNDEAVWYPLSAVTEFIAVVLLATPGLVPPPSVLPKHAQWA